MKENQVPYVIVLNGARKNASRAYQEILPGSFVICADSGVELLGHPDILPNLVIGDFDSLSPEQVELLRGKGAQICSYPSMKDKSDFELALDSLPEGSVQELLILFPFGGAFDHILMNIFVLKRFRDTRFPITMYDGEVRAELLRSNMSTVLSATNGSRFSLIPLDPEVLIHRLSGSMWELKNETLTDSSARGLSNLILQSEVRLDLGSGTLLVIQSHHQTS